MLMTGMQTIFFHRMQPYFATSIENGLKLLLETKHLYQTVRVEPPNGDIALREMKELTAGASPIGGSQFRDIGNPIEFFGISLSKIEWTIKNPGGRKSLPMVTPSETVYLTVEFVPPTVKLFCKTCKRLEAYNFQYGSDLLNAFREAKRISEMESEQVFSLAYQCQSCKSIPEIFVVQRDSLKLVQSGRTPIEEFELPSFLPKKQKEYFSDAIVASNSGQVLAGKFLLRTFIEQYIREFTKNTTSQNIDKLLEEYAESLPKDFKDRFPSLEDVYAKLSIDIHKADSTLELFIQSQTDIEEHFEAKKVFKLS